MYNSWPQYLVRLSTNELDFSKMSKGVFHAVTGIFSQCFVCMQSNVTLK